MLINLIPFYLYILELLVNSTVWAERSRDIYMVTKRGTRLKRLSMHAHTKLFFLCRGSTSWVYDECSHTELHAQNCPAVGVYNRG